MFQKSTTSSPSTRFVFVYAIALLLLSCATQRASSMSLERLGVDQNDLNSAAIARANNYAEKTETDNGPADIVVDDMELEAVPTSGNTDTYLLVPAGGVAERESVEKNTIENAGDPNDAAEEPQPNEATDMLMVESNDAPMHVSFLAVPTEQNELADVDQVVKAEEIINDDESATQYQVPNSAEKILGIPTEPELQEVVPVFAEEVPLESIDRLDTALSSADVENGSHNEDTVSVGHETLADMIDEAVLEGEKDMESAPSSDELPNIMVPIESEIVDDNETNVQKNEEADKLQEAAEQEVIESSSAMEEDLLPEIVSVPVETVHIEQEKSEENSVSDTTVEEVNVEENEIKEDEAKEQSVENVVPEDLANKPEVIVANVEPVAEEIGDVQPERTDDDELNRLSDTIVQIQSEENDIANSNLEAENTNVPNLTNEEEENVSMFKDEIKVDTSEDSATVEEHEVNPMAEAIKKEIEVNLAEMLDEDNKAEETIDVELTPHENHGENNKQDEEIIANKQGEKTQIIEEAQQIENDQIAEESQTVEELQAIEEIQTPEENQLDGETLTLEGNQVAEEAQITEVDKEQETMDDTNVQVEGIKPEAVNNQLDDIMQEAAITGESLQDEIKENLVEETLPVGEVTEVAKQEDTPADEIPEQALTVEDVKENNKLDEATSENIKQEEPIIKETEPDEIKQEQVEQQFSETSSQLSEAEQQELTNEELQETEVNQADVSEPAAQADSQQDTEEKLEEDSVSTEVEAAPETQETVEKLEAVQNPAETETQSEIQNLEEPQVTHNAELVEAEEPKPETPLQLVENQKVPELQQQEEALETPSAELQQQNVEETAQETLTEEMQQPTVEEEAQATQHEVFVQQTIEEEAHETKPEVPQQYAEEQQQQESEQTLQQVVEQQPLKEAEETENLQQQVEAHLEEEVPSVQEQMDQLKQEESAIPQQIPEEQPQTEAQPSVAQQILADTPAEVPLEIVTESLNSGPVEPTNSLLTTIIQVPQQQQIEQQQSPVKVENEEAPLTATLVNVNNPTATATAPTVAPLDVMDSVLNYVNASFMQLNGNKQQLTPQNLKNDDDDGADLNAQLRRYDGAQVWRIVVQTDHDRKMADELQTKYGKCGQ